MVKINEVHILQGLFNIIFARPVIVHYTRPVQVVLIPTVFVLLKKTVNNMTQCEQEELVNSLGRFVCNSFSSSFAKVKHESNL